MKKTDFIIIAFWIVLIIGVLLEHPVKAQTIKHHHYITYFNAKLHCPDSVSWNLGPQDICKPVARKDKFAKDPLNPNSPSPSQFIQLPGYKANKSLEGAQGHLYSYESAMCNPVDNTECFFVDQMYWQYQAFNAGDWKTVEIYERQLASKGNIHVIAGFVGIAQTLSTGLPIVSYMYKAIYHDGVWECWIMPNLPTSEGHEASDPIWHVTKQILDSKTNLKL